MGGLDQTLVLPGRGVVDKKASEVFWPGGGGDEKFFETDSRIVFLGSKISVLHGFSPKLTI